MSGILRPVIGRDDARRFKRVQIDMSEAWERAGMTRESGGPLEPTQINVMTRLLDVYEALPHALKYSANTKEIARLVRKQMQSVKPTPP